MTLRYAKIANRTVADEYFAVTDKVDALYGQPNSLPADAIRPKMARLRRPQTIADLSASVGRAIEFPPESIPAMTHVVALTCNEQAIALGLIKPPTEPPIDATDTERLRADAGRTIARR